MLLRRFLLITCILFTLIAISTYSGKARASSYADEQHVQTGNLNIIRSFKTSARAQTSVCPKMPTPQRPGTALLAFCAPKYLGNIAGPYGSHIVVMGENLSQMPSAWLIIPKNQSTTSSPDLVDCTRQSIQFCAQLPAPQVSKLDQLTLFSWIWGKDFPNTVGDYHITAIIGKLHVAHPQIVSTAVSFTLLTSEAPCITLDNSNCSATQPTSVIDPSKTRALTLFGSNWALGWEANPITESVEVTARCSTPQYCANRTPLFDIIIPPSQIDPDGSFSSKISLPTNISGTYNLAATNHVESTNIADDTFADGTLSIGAVGDINSLVIKFIPPPIPPTINTNILNILATVALLLASAGIAYYYLFFRQRQTPVYQASPILSSTGKQQFIQPLSVRISSGTLSSSYSSPSERKISEITARNTTSLQHEHSLVAFPPGVASAPTASIISWISKFISPSKSDISRKIRLAIKKWREENNLDKVITVASEILTADLSHWDTLLHELAIGPKPFDFTPQFINQYALHAIRSIRSDPQHLLIHCSRALIYCAIARSLTQKDPQEKADILFDIGFAYVNLAAIANHTALSLLKRACHSYEEALDIYDRHGNVQACTTTLIALGDVWFALSEVYQAKHNDRIMWKQKASRYYKDARQKTPPHLQNDIQRRINYVDAEVAKSKA